MNHNEILKLRAERIKAFRAASGGGTLGVVPAGMAAFLLAVSRSRIKTLVRNERLETVSQAGQRWILFSSISDYAQENQSQRGVSRLDMSKSDTSKGGVPKAGMANSDVSKTKMAKSGTSKKGMPKSDMSKAGASKVGTI